MGGKQIYWKYKLKCKEKGEQREEKLRILWWIRHVTFVVNY